MSFFDDLFGTGGSSNTGSTSTTSTTQLPGYLNKATKDLIASGVSLTQQPYQAYAYPRIAGFNQNQNDAFGQVQNAAQSAAPTFNTAINNTAGIASAGSQYNPVSTGQWNSQAAQQYMNPYLDQSLQGQIGLLNQQRAQGSKSISDASIRNGSFGGARSGVESAEYNNNYDNLIGNTISQGYNTAYNNAQNSFNADQGRSLQAQTTNAGNALQNTGLQLQANNLMGGLAQQGQATALSGATALGQVGAQQQALQQQGLDLGYQNFKDQQQYPYNNLNFLSGLINGTPYSSSSTSTTNQQQANPGIGQQILGYGLGAASLYSMFSGAGI